MSANWTGVPHLEPALNAELVESVLAAARQLYDFVALLEVCKANAAVYLGIRVIWRLVIDWDELVAERLGCRILSEASYYTDDRDRDDKYG